MTRMLAIYLGSEHDVVGARQRARQIAGLLGFGGQDQARIATAVSEIARNAFLYARAGRVEFAIDAQLPALSITVSDSGGGIGHLDEILAGRYRSQTGLGVGIQGARRLMDASAIDTGAGGTVVTLKKILPAGIGVPTGAQLAALTAGLAANPLTNALAEVQQQNQELLQTLAELRARQDELLNLTRELEDTNRGVVALYAEIDEKAGHLRRANEMKSRFLSNMSHEFRTPLSSIRALAQLLLERTDGELSGEQEKQVLYIQNAARELSEVVNDLLDLAKIEAGKTEVRALPFAATDLFSALRGMLRPLLLSSQVELVFDEVAAVGTLYSDEGKVSQILRNFISNALKFTERGEVRIGAALEEGGDWVRFSVSDTGIGIAERDQQFIFEEFSQVENRLQQHSKGTGLGLPLCQRLAELLGGRVELRSTAGVGSVFAAVIPRRHALAAAPSALPPLAPALQPGRLPVLVVEDHEPTRLLYEKYLQNSPFQMYVARSLDEARALCAAQPPRAIVLDILLGGETAWHWLETLKRSAAIPVLVVTEIADKRRAFALGADRYYLKPLLRGDLLAALQQLTGVVATAPSTPAALHTAKPPS